MQVSSAQVKEYLGDISYPASKEEVLEAARKRNAPDEVMQELESLPDMEFKSPADLSSEFSKA